MSEPQRRIHDGAVEFFGGAYGPRMPLIFSPGLDTAWAALGAELQKSELPQRLRELAILVTARCWDSQFEWHAHEPLAVAAGVARPVIESIRAGERPESAADADELAVYDYCEELLERHAVSDAIYARVRDRLGVTQHVELTVLIGYYSNVAISLAAHAAPLPVGAEPPLPPLHRASAES
jgi:4-carboxymuconolactone decarboxylase